MTRMTTSEHGVSFIEKWENTAPRLRARRCLGDRFELSYGITFYPDGSAVGEGDTITWERHVEMFQFAIGVFEETVRKRVTVELNQNQFDALVALAWNIGAGNFASSSVLRYTNERRWEDAAEAFGMWKFATTSFENDRETRITHEGEPAKWFAARRGLVRRHYAEALMYSGLEWEWLYNDIDMVSLKVRREWDPSDNRYEDRVLEQTPWSSILMIGKGRPLPQAVYAGEPTPLPAPVADTPPAPPPEPKKQSSLATSRTLWGGSIMGIVSTPEFQNTASMIAGTEAGGFLGRCFALCGLALVFIGRIGAAGPIPIVRMWSRA